MFKRGKEKSAKGKDGWSPHFIHCVQDMISHKPQKTIDSLALGTPLPFYYFGDIFAFSKFVERYLTITSMDMFISNFFKGKIFIKFYRLLNVVILLFYAR